MGLGDQSRAAPCSIQHRDAPTKPGQIDGGGQTGRAGPYNQAVNCARTIHE